MRKAVKNYLNGRKVLWKERISVVQKSRYQFESLQLRMDDVSKELDIELLMQGQSFPKFFFRNVYL